MHRRATTACDSLTTVGGQSLTDRAATAASRVAVDHRAASTRHRSTGHRRRTRPELAARLPR